MKTRTPIVISLFCALLLPSFAFGEEVAVKETTIPAVGEVYKIDQAEYKVVGAGVAPFEYTSSGESLEIKILNKVPGTIVITPAKGEVVKVDPAVPMVKIAGTPHKEFVKNAYLKKTAKGKPFLLLEYLR